MSLTVSRLADWRKDLKPENILYKDEAVDSEVVIADFGVSNFVKDNEMLKSVCGSPGYAGNISCLAWLYILII